MPPRGNGAGVDGKPGALGPPTGGKLGGSAVPKLLGVVGGADGEAKPLGFVGG